MEFNFLHFVIIIYIFLKKQFILIINDAINNFKYEFLKARKRFLRRKSGIMVTNRSQLSIECEKCFFFKGFSITSCFIPYVKYHKISSNINTLCFLYFSEFSIKIKNFGNICHSINVWL